jgi:hypothetical protein
MPLSTFNSNPEMTSGKHTKAILFGLLMGMFLILIAENFLRFKGGEPGVRDTAELWASQRHRASSIGDDALILVGSSRVQLGLDLGVLAKETGMTPIQLAIDGSPNLEVIENLANDETVTGTVLISTSLRLLFPTNNAIRINQWIDVYEKKYRKLWHPEKEQLLKAKLQSVSALYANIIPLDALVPLLFNEKKKLRNVYLKTLPSRERNADYSLVDMPGFYIRRVERKLFHPLPAEAYKSYDSFQESVISVTKEKNSAFNADPKRLQRIKSALRKLKNRNVEVIISRFPLSGLVESISDIRYPKELWDMVVSDLGVRIIDYRDYPELAYQLPDGAHLDITQKSEFTHRFARILLGKDTSY